MQRIDVASAVAALPAPAAPGAPGYFTGGDPVGGTPATVLSADWANLVQEELMAIVLGAGLAPSKANRGQVLAALLQLLGATGNLAANGFIEIPVGDLKLIINWGTGTQADGSGGQLITFSQPYASAVFHVFPVNRAGGPPSAFHGWAPISLTQAKIYSATASGAAAAAGVAFSWLAFGI